MCCLNCHLMKQLFSFIQTLYTYRNVCPLQGIQFSIIMIKILLTSFFPQDGNCPFIYLVIVVLSIQKCKPHPLPGIKRLVWGSRWAFAGAKGLYLHNLLAYFWQSVYFSARFRLFLRCTVLTGEKTAFPLAVRGGKKFQNVCFDIKQSSYVNFGRATCCLSHGSLFLILLISDSRSVIVLLHLHSDCFLVRTESYGHVDLEYRLTTTVIVRTEYIIKRQKAQTPKFLSFTMKSH